MAVPNTTTFSLQDVVNEVNPTTDDLVDCFADAISAYFDPTYSGSKNNLLNFRNYGNDAIAVGSIQGFNSSSNKVLTLNVTAQDKLAFFAVSTDADVSSLATTSLADSSGAVWTKYSGGTYQNVFSTSDLTTTGNRTLTLTTATSYVIVGAWTLINCLGDACNYTFTGGTADSINNRLYGINDSKSKVVHVGSSDSGFASTYAPAISAYTGGGSVATLESSLQIPNNLGTNHHYSFVSAVFGGGLESLEMHLIEVYHSGYTGTTIGCSDTTPPAQVSQPTATNICQTTFTLSWAATTDNVAVTGYKVYKNGSLYQDVGNVLTKNITGQTAAATNNWTVTAYDAAANESTASTARSVTQGTTVYSFSMSTSLATTADNACLNYFSSSTTRYKTVSGTLPVNGQVIYTNTCGTTKFNGGNYWWSDGTFDFTVSTVGVIGNRQASVC